MRPFRYYGGRWTRDEGLGRLMENVEIWKIKNFPHSHFSHRTTTGGNGDFKKNSFFIFTEDERRGTRERETRDERTHLPSQQQKQAINTHKILHKTGKQNLNKMTVLYRKENHPVKGG